MKTRIYAAPAVKGLNSFRQNNSWQIVLVTEFPAGIDTIIDASNGFSWTSEETHLTIQRLY